MKSTSFHFTGKETKEQLIDMLIEAGAYCNYTNYYDKDRKDPIDKERLLKKESKSGILKMCKIFKATGGNISEFDNERLREYNNEVQTMRENELVNKLGYNPRSIVSDVLGHSVPPSIVDVSAEVNTEHKKIYASFNDFLLKEDVPEFTKQVLPLYQKVQAEVTGYIVGKEDLVKRYEEFTGMRFKVQDKAVVNDIVLNNDYQKVGKSLEIFLKVAETVDFYLENSYHEKPQTTPEDFLNAIKEALKGNSFETLYYFVNNHIVEKEEKLKNLAEELEDLKDTTDELERKEDLLNLVTDYDEHSKLIPKTLNDELNNRLLNQVLNKLDHSQIEDMVNRYCKANNIILV